MTGQEMRYLIRTGNCPQCKGPLTNREKGVGTTQAVGDCEPCAITWFSQRTIGEGYVEAYPIGERYTGYA